MTTEHSWEYDTRMRLMVRDDGLKVEVDEYRADPGRYDRMVKKAVVYQHRESSSGDRSVNLVINAGYEWKDGPYVRYSNCRGCGAPAEPQRCSYCLTPS